MSLVYSSSQACVQLALETGRLKGDFGLQHSLALHQTCGCYSTAAVCSAMMPCQLLQEMVVSSS